MLGKLIIGGVTLATVGYGIKIYCEDEGCSLFDDVISDERTESSPPAVVPEDDIALNFYYYKVSLWESSLEEARSLFNQLENCSQDIKLDQAVAEDTIEGSVDVAKVTKRMKQYGKLFAKADRLLRNELYVLRNIIEVSSDYSAYTDEMKATVESVYALANVMVLLCQEPIMADDGTVSKHSKELLKGQKVIINSISTKVHNHE